MITFTNTLFTCCTEDFCDNLFRNTLASECFDYTPAFTFSSFFPANLLCRGNLVLYVPFSSHIVFVFDFFLRGKGSNFRRLKQETKEVPFQARRTVSKNRPAFSAGRLIQAFWERSSRIFCGTAYTSILGEVFTIPLLY